MFVLLVFGAVVGGVQKPELLAHLGEASVGFRTPSFALPEVSWEQLFVGVVLLALPQLPLTLGNAVIAITSENNRLFPQHAVTEGRVAASTGFMTASSI